MCPTWKTIAAIFVNASEECRPTAGHEIEILVFCGQDNLVDNKWHITSNESVSFYCHRCQKCSISTDSILLPYILINTLKNENLYRVLSAEATCYNM
jgi:hypothetical protein